MSEVKIKTESGWKDLTPNNIKGASSITVPTGMKVKMLSDGTKWGRIFWHDVSTSSTWFADATEAKNCNESNRYSKLGSLENFRINNEYEFMLVYPKYSTTKYNRWIQTANPLVTSTEASKTKESMGYSPVQINLPNNWGYGIGLSNHPDVTFMDCEAGNDNWFGAIGLYSASAYSDSYPAPTDGTSGSSDKQKEVELWVRLYNDIDVKVKNEDVIYINSKEDFDLFYSDHANGNSYSGKTIILMTDISTSGDAEHVDFNTAQKNFQRNFRWKWTYNKFEVHRK